MKWYWGLCWRIPLALFLFLFLFTGSIMLAYGIWGPKENKKESEMHLEAVLEAANKKRESHVSGLGLADNVGLNEHGFRVTAFIIEKGFDSIFDHGGTPSVLLTTRKYATEFIHLFYATYSPVFHQPDDDDFVSQKQVGDVLYTQLKFFAPRPFSVVVIPHESVQPGEMFFMDADRLDEEGMCYYVRG